MNVPRTLDFLFPALLIFFVPLDLLIGFSKGLYPTQATLGILLGAVVGGLMARRLRQPRQFAIDSSDPEAVANAVINRQLNFGLGAGLMWFAAGLVIFGFTMIITQPSRPLPFNNLTPAKLVELGFIALFNLMVFGLEAFAAKIYLLGRR